MPVFPPAAPVTITVDGRRLATYVHAYLERGRVYAPAGPLLGLFVDRLWLSGGALVVERHGRRVRVSFAARFTGDLDGSYVAIGPLLRALGETVRYRAGARAVDIQSAAVGAIASPTPFVASPATPTRSVFTPQPAVTPRPVWSGPPLPRRTPLPAPPRRLTRSPRRGGG